MIPYLAVGGATAVLAFLFATSNKLKCRTYSLKSNKITHPITVAQVSDLHESQFGNGQKTLLSMLCEVAPDAIVITGDTVEDRGRFGGRLTEDNPAHAFLSGAAKIAPTFMVFGNHERFIPEIDRLISDIESLGVRLLHPSTEEGISAAELAMGDEEVLVCGVADPYFTYDAVSRADKNLRELMCEDKDTKNQNIKIWRDKVRNSAANVKSENKLSILLSHRPEEYELYEKLPFDVVFSGHAHGGQWRLPPFINGVYSPHQGLFPKHAGGAYKLGRVLHVVSRGLSKKRMIRIFNRPEVCVLKITPEK